MDKRSKDSVEFSKGSLFTDAAVFEDNNVLSMRKKSY